MNSNKPILSKVSAIIRQDTGVGFYRLMQPLRFLKRQGLVKDARMTPFSGQNVFGEDKQANLIGVPEKLLKAIVEKTDILWSNITSNPKELTRMLDIREWTGCKLVIDIDDNIYAVSNDNPGQKATRTLKDQIDLCFKVADGVTVSVPSLVEVFKPLNENIFVQKNAMDFSIMDKIPIKKHRELRIGWQGAYGHRADLELVFPAIRELKKKYNFKFIVFGMTPNDGFKKPDFDIEFVAWVPFADEQDGFIRYPYYETLGELGLDIAVAPLIDSSYNRCKSNLRIIDNSSFKTPVVASPVVNYKGTPCMYANSNYEWYDKLEQLLKSKKLREEQGLKQYEFVKKNYNMETNVQELASWFKSLKRRTDMEPR
jgi:glycosyltransferase involved in cell wall biosynthesis